MVLLATLATIIASQAIITGTYSMTRQAMQLGWFPGVRIRQTSDEEYGQIYVPFINWTMMVCTVALTVGFATSDRLAGAYGTAVSTTMLLTTALLYHVMRERWGWSVPAALTVSAIFIVIDFALFAANLVKIAQGGWVPLGFGHRYDLPAQRSGRPGAHEAHYWRRWLLCARRERPCHGAAEQRDELAPLHLRGHSITSSASATSLSGIWRPSAFAVFRLIASSNFIGC
jgi:hypothetical protein